MRCCRFTIVAVILGAGCSKTPCEKSATRYAELAGAELAAIGANGAGVDTMRSQFEFAACKDVKVDVSCVDTARTIDDARACLAKLGGDGPAYKWDQQLAESLHAAGKVTVPIDVLDKLAARLVALDAVAVPAGLPERCPASITDVAYVDDDEIASIAKRQVPSDRAVHAGDYAAKGVASYIGHDLPEVERLLPVYKWALHAGAASTGVAIITKSKAIKPGLLGSEFVPGELAAQIVVFDAANHPVCRTTVAAHSSEQVVFQYRDRPGEKESAGSAKLEQDFTEQINDAMQTAGRALIGK
jgi:hypothetical protein